MTDAAPGAASSMLRHWQAPCPNCGAPVEFRSTASASAVCAYCRSTVVREGESLRRIGQSAELFEDHSPLQLGVTGRYRDRAFTLIGRLQQGYCSDAVPPGDAGRIEARWNEWHMLYDDGGSAWLSEDNDDYVISEEADPMVPPPPLDKLPPGRGLGLAGTHWDVTLHAQVRVLAAEGELPTHPILDRAYALVELRNPHNQLAWLDFADAARPQFSIGRPVRLANLELAGLRGEAADAPANTRTLAARSFACPHCGAAVTVRLGTTLSVYCSQCHSVIDISTGIGAELRHWQQQQLFPPALPLGKAAAMPLAGELSRPWQVVGYQVKQCSPADAESFVWNEYLLFNEQEGFAFLVQAQDRWVGYRTLTGAPLNTGIGTLEMNWKGIIYDRREQYPAVVVYVAGEFYWRVEKDQASHLADYCARGTNQHDRLFSEQTPERIVWSYGRPVPDAEVARAFGLELDRLQSLHRKQAPASGGESLLGTIFKGLFVLAVAVSSACWPHPSGRNVPGVSTPFARDAGSLQ